VDPDVNLATGIRWLFHKKQLAESRLKKEVTWEYATTEYKGITGQLGKVKKSDEIVQKLRDYYGQLKQSRL